jgi:tetratricopeptide (TPR) repeat protein
MYMTMVRKLRRSLGLRATVFIILSFFVLGASRSRELWTSWHHTSSAPLLRVPSASDEAADSREVIAFLEARVRRDPGDADIYSKLAGLYLQQLRETGALGDLGLALQAAHKSLAIVPAVRNTDGLTSLALAEFASHDFRAARDHARQLAQLDGTGTPYAILGDALAELGDYGQAERAYKQMQQRSGGAQENVATRMARLAQLKGDNAGAERGFADALALELRRGEPSRERIAWFHWQIGDTAFFAGDDQAAQNNYEDALTVYPGYFRALASRGRLWAARGDLQHAIHDYEAAVRILPDPTFVAELGDIYKLSAQQKDAETQYELVELIGHLSKVNGVLYNRQVVMFYADHDMKTREAYIDAKGEYGIRRDILGADALAWTALKAGKIREAQAAMKAALRLGTRDPRLYYHAGMIARAAGQHDVARAYLRRALALNPVFDPLQATVARNALDREQTVAR